jgi:hypothetical protein
MTKQTKFTYFLDTVALFLFGLIPVANHFNLTSRWERMLLVIIIFATYGLIFLGRHIYLSINRPWPNNNKNKKRHHRFKRRQQLNLERLPGLGIK